MIERVGSDAGAGVGNGHGDVLAVGSGDDAHAVDRTVNFVDCVRGVDQHVDQDLRQPAVGDQDLRQVARVVAFEAGHRAELAPDQAQRLIDDLVGVEELCLFTIGIGPGEDPQVSHDVRDRRGRRQHLFE